MNRILSIFLMLIALTGCNNQATTEDEVGSLAQSETTRIERESEPPIYDLGDDDAEMNEAIETAKSTIDRFNSALKSGNPNFVDFALKTGFSSSKGTEHIWVVNITNEGNNFYGIVNNLPESTKEVKMGDRIQIHKDSISDWMYTNNQMLVGGYTIRVLRKRMTNSERRLFDEESQLIIED